MTAPPLSLDTEVARRAKGLGMHVIAHDPYASADRARAIGVELVSFDEAIATADFISLHMPLTAATVLYFFGQICAVSGAVQSGWLRNNWT
ncbi:hypothetical protein Vadar_033428 [Vaccinium darrowii]|uniref:Uncharacterized protein n=1 Tax=Vaccinium darrowii TaxID=229202 RepID=A0ACB7X5Z6_9ERIC|nr:hypothetical protein Vadar_033428 [Vaccinium darrowii]